jgi:hypothetical protein
MGDVFSAGIDRIAETHGDRTVPHVQEGQR